MQTQGPVIISQERDVGMEKAVWYRRGCLMGCRVRKEDGNTKKKESFCTEERGFPPDTSCRWCLRSERLCLASSLPWDLIWTCSGPSLWWAGAAGPHTSAWGDYGHFSFTRALGTQPGCPLSWVQPELLTLSQCLGCPRECGSFPV